MEEAERQARLANLKRLRGLAEKAYDDMYEVYSQREINSCYRNAKEYYYDAISLAGELGLTEEAETMGKRLQHIKEVYRSQFAG